MSSEHRLLVTYIGGEPLILLQGENKAIRFRLTNSGSQPINEVWMVSDPDDEIWIGVDDDFENCEWTYPLGTSLFYIMPASTTLETIRSRNSLHPQEPQRIPLNGSAQSSILQPGDSTEVTTIFHAESAGTHKLCLLFVFREVCFRSTCVVQIFTLVSNFNGRIILHSFIPRNWRVHMKSGRCSKPRYPLSHHNCRTIHTYWMST